MTTEIKHRISLMLLFSRIVVAILALATGAFVGALLWFDFGPKPGSPILGDYVTHAAILVGAIAILVNLAMSTMSHRLFPVRNGRVQVAISLRAIAGSLVFAFAGFLAATAMMLEQSWGAMVIAIAMPLGVASRFPIRAGGTKGELKGG